MTQIVPMAGKGLILTAVPRREVTPTMMGTFVSPVKASTDIRMSVDSEVVSTGLASADR
jgi:hypothetical protein